jgi:hypothetical protein
MIAAKSSPPHALIRTIRGALTGTDPERQAPGDLRPVVSLAGVWLRWWLAELSSITIVIYFGLLPLTALAYARRHRDHREVQCSCVLR